MPALFIAGLVTLFGFSLFIGGCFYTANMSLVGFIGFFIAMFGCQRFAHVYDKLYCDDDDDDGE